MGDGASTSAAPFGLSEAASDPLPQNPDASHAVCRSAEPRERKPGARTPRSLPALAWPGKTSSEKSRRSSNSRASASKKVLRDELRRRWTRPPRKTMRDLQIARLERTSARLVERRPRNGDPRAIERLLRVADRLDRYHGFSKFMPSGVPRSTARRARIAAREDSNSAAARVLGPPSADRAMDDAESESQRRTRAHRVRWPRPHSRSRLRQIGDLAQATEPAEARQDCSARLDDKAM